MALHLKVHRTHSYNKSSLQAAGTPLELVVLVKLTSGDSLAEVVFIPGTYLFLFARVGILDSILIRASNQIGYE